MKIRITASLLVHAAGLAVAEVPARDDAGSTSRLRRVKLLLESTDPDALVKVSNLGVGATATPSWMPSDSSPEAPISSCERIGSAVGETIGSACSDLVDWFSDLVDWLSQDNTSSASTQPSISPGSMFCNGPLREEPYYKDFCMEGCLTPCANVLCTKVDAPDEALFETSRYCQCVDDYNSIECEDVGYMTICRPSDLGEKRSPSGTHCIKAEGAPPEGCPESFAESTDPDAPVLSKVSNLLGAGLEKEKVNPNTECSPPRTKGTGDTDTSHYKDFCSDTALYSCTNVLCQLTDDEVRIDITDKGETKLVRQRKCECVDKCPSISCKDEVNEIRKEWCVVERNCVCAKQEDKTASGPGEEAPIGGRGDEGSPLESA